jgi:hypothetical protein
VTDPNMTEILAKKNVFVSPSRPAPSWFLIAVLPIVGLLMIAAVAVGFTLRGMALEQPVVPLDGRLATQAVSTIVVGPPMATGPYVASPVDWLKVDQEADAAAAEASTEAFMATAEAMVPQAYNSVPPSAVNASPVVAPPYPPTVQPTPTSDPSIPTETPIPPTCSEYNADGRVCEAIATLTPVPTATPIQECSKEMFVQRTFKLYCINTGKWLTPSASPVAMWTPLPTPTLYIMSDASN